MPMYQAFKCTACGAQNAASSEASCGFCGSAAPASALSKEVRTHRRSLFVDPAPSYQAAPPPPVDEGIAVDGTGVVCRSCGRYAAVAGKRMPGNLALEVLLWFFYLIPGVIYTMWQPAGFECGEILHRVRQPGFASDLLPRGAVGSSAANTAASLCCVELLGPPSVTSSREARRRTRSTVTACS